MGDSLSAGALAESAIDIGTTGSFLSALFVTIVTLAFVLVVTFGADWILTRHHNEGV